jgi:hypothetical protein
MKMKVAARKCSPILTQTGRAVPGELSMPLAGGPQRCNLLLHRRGLGAECLRGESVARFWFARRESLSP